MGRQIHVDLDRTIPTPPARVHAALADYHGRARILPANYLDWTVEEGGTGAGTVVSYRLRAGRRERPYRMASGPSRAAERSITIRPRTPTVLVERARIR